VRGAAVCCATAGLKHGWPVRRSWIGRAIIRGVSTGAAEELAFDFSKPFAVVYGQDATVVEVETAWRAESTLESAEGSPLIRINSPTAESIRRASDPRWNAHVNEIDKAARYTIAPGRNNFVADSFPTLYSGDDSAALSPPGMESCLRGRLARFPPHAKSFW